MWCFCKPSQYDDLPSHASTCGDDDEGHNDEAVRFVSSTSTSMLDEKQIIAIIHLEEIPDIQNQPEVNFSLEMEMNVNTNCSMRKPAPFYNLLELNDDLVGFMPHIIRVPSQYRLAELVHDDSTGDAQSNRAVQLKEEWMMPIEIEKRNEWLASSYC